MYRCSIRVKLINYLLKGSNLMASIDEVIASVSELNGTLQSIDAKLDEVRTLIAALKEGSVTQEQLDQLSSLVESAKSEASQVFSESDELTK